MDDFERQKCPVRAADDLPFGPASGLLIYGGDNGGAHLNDTYFISP